MTTEKAKERIRKVLELVRRGVGGEKEAAEIQLVKLLKKHNLTIEDFDDDQTSEYKISWNSATPFEKKLVFRIIKKVINNGEFFYRRYVGSRNNILIELTKVQKMEFDFLFDAYKKELQKHLEASFWAFIHANDIGPEEEGSDEPIEATPEEIEEMERISNMMLATKKVKIHKQIS